jgi:hypothetical protein
MIPLAITSTKGWIRRLGGKRWQWLHRLVYVSATAGVIHYYWLVKSDIRQPLLYGFLVGVLLAFRSVAWGLGQARKRVPILTTAHANEISGPGSPPALAAVSRPPVLETGAAAVDQREETSDIFLS